MPDYKPLPMKDTVNPQPMHPASEKMSQWMNSYMPTVMNKIMAGSVGPTNMGMGNSSGAGISDMLFKAIHPDTFERVLNFIKPTPRQEGGPVEPGKEYTVGEAGPEKFRPNVPGDIIPGPGGGQLRYRGQDEGWDPLLAGRQAFGPGEPSPLGTPKTFGESWIGQNVIAPIKSWAEAGWLDRPSGTPAPLGTRSTARFPIEEGRGIPETGGERAPLGWQDYGEGMKYKWSGPETEATRTGDEAARGGFRGGYEGAAPLGYGMNLRTPLGESRFDYPSGRSYYDVHPEEKATQDVYDMTRPPIGFEGNEQYNMDRLRASPRRRVEMEKERAAMETNARNLAAGTYGRALEYGIGTPGAQEKLAHAKYLSEMPAAHLEGINQQNQAHLEGIQKQVEGHLEAAKIAAEVKDPIIKEIGALMVQGQKEAAVYGTSFDPQKIAAPILKMYHALGKISDKEWKMLPKEYTEEAKVERRLPGETIAAYLKRTKQQ